MPRYLTKSRFKLALDCPAKLFYTGNPQYPDKSQDDAFLEALAEGGFQVGALAKCYYPDGIEVSERGYDIPLQRTQELLTQDNVTIFEGAFKYQNLFIRADIIEKKGDEYVTVEKSEDVELDFETIGSIVINSSNKEGIEENLGFKFYFPEMIKDKYRIQGSGYTGITIFDVKLSEVENLKDTFLKATVDEETYLGLSGFDMNRHVAAHYSDSDEGNFYLYIEKHKPELFPDVKVVKEANIDDINYKVLETTRAFYHQKYKNGWTFDDMTKKPEKIIKLKYLIWEYNGLTYSIAPAGVPEEKELKEEEAIKFVKSYMEELENIEK